MSGYGVPLFRFKSRCPSCGKVIRVAVKASVGKEKCIECLVREHYQIGARK